MTVDATDLREAASLAGRGLAAATTLVRDTHVAIARRAFTLSGPPGKPAHVLHDTISRGVYGAVGGVAKAAGSTAGIVAAARAARRPAYVPLAERPRGNLVVGALNGAWGDLLVRARSPLALPLTLHYDVASAAATGSGTSATVAAATVTGDVVVFVHGLCETERAWRNGAGEHWGDPASTHGSRLRQELGLMPVFVRYNSGLHISDNGAELDRALGELVADWPVPVTRLTLIGHSMGGLVIRSACALGCARDAPWVQRVARIVYLGSPHLGAPLERAVTVAGLALRAVPETRPLAQALATRSVGIKDLRYGDVAATDWADIVDADAWRPEPESCTALLPTADHYYVGATIARRHDTIAARVIGDAFVPYASASGTGRHRRLELAVDRGCHLGGLHHFDLLNHPRVYAQLRNWLAS